MRDPAVTQDAPTVDRAERHRAPNSERTGSRVLAPQVGCLPTGTSSEEAAMKDAPAEPTGTTTGPAELPTNPPNGRTAGVDWAKDDHVVAVVDSTGTAIDRFTVPHTGTGLAELTRHLAQACCAEVASQLSQPGAGMRHREPVDRGAGAVHHRDDVIVFRPVHSGGPAIGRIRRQFGGTGSSPGGLCWGILHRSLLAASPSGEAPDLRCQDAPTVGRAERHRHHKGAPVSKAGNRLLRTTLVRAADHARRADPQLAQIYYTQMVER